mmetsp:Transcript_18303/g.32797  ORF Transcript_18303/g.32797 Transcript_18303/m.32797 type:complete len:211 (-) Transcript_18303:114-746(-)
MPNIFLLSSLDRDRERSPDLGVKVNVNSVRGELIHIVRKLNSLRIKLSTGLGLDCLNDLGRSHASVECAVVLSLHTESERKNLETLLHLQSSVLLRFGFGDLSCLLHAKLLHVLGGGLSGDALREQVISPETRLDGYDVAFVSSAGNVFFQKHINATLFGVHSQIPRGMAPNNSRANRGHPPLHQSSPDVFARRASTYHVDTTGEEDGID